MADSDLQILAALSNFDSGEPYLDDWLKKKAHRYKTDVGRCFLLCVGSHIGGFYDLRTGAVQRETAPQSMWSTLPNPIPVVLISQMAVDKRYQGLGSVLMRDILGRALQSRDAGLFAVIGYAFTDRARQFNLAHGFVESPLESNVFIQPLEAAASTLDELRRRTGPDRQWIFKDFNELVRANVPAPPKEIRFFPQNFACSNCGRCCRGHRTVAVGSELHEALDRETKPIS